MSRRKLARTLAVLTAVGSTVVGGAVIAPNAYADMVDAGGALECRPNSRGEDGFVLIWVRSYGRTQVSINGFVLRNYDNGSSWRTKLINTNRHKISSWKAVAHLLDQQATDVTCGWE